MDPHQFDENGNAIPDGMDLARQLSTAIEALPTEPSANHPYVTHYLLRGVETCEVCKVTVNMGFMVITHPLENQEIRVQYIAKHYLEHGGFSFAGDLTSGRLNPALLAVKLCASSNVARMLPGSFSKSPSSSRQPTDRLRIERRPWRSLSRAPPRPAPSPSR